MMADPRYGLVILDELNIVLRYGYLSVEAVVAGLARQMNLQLVAEGVENAEVLAALQAHGIGLFQGYHFHRPQPAAALIAAGGPPS
jgi:EAL domain-containing protein (putative c-di-GMP-specific phosphodiesterase class I)